MIPIGSVSVRVGRTLVGKPHTPPAPRTIRVRLKPDAVLVDVSLPDGDGVTLARSLAALPWRPRIVLTSTDPEATTEAVAQSAGAVGFVAKQDLPGGRLFALLTRALEP